MRYLVAVVCVLTMGASAVGQSWPVQKVERSLGLLTVAEGGGSCTAFSINEDKGYWLTAKHCTIEGRQHLINGIAALVFYRDPSDDIVVLQGPKVPALALSSSPSPGTPIAIIGFPGGLPLTGVNVGVLSSLAVMFTMDEDRQPYVVVTGTSGVAGMSGSPMITLKGEVVSVYTFSICRSEQPICYVASGVSYQSVRAIMRMFGDD